MRTCCFNNLPSGAGLGWQNSDASGLDVDSEFGTKDLLAAVYDAGRRRRFRSADVVGAGRDHPDLRALLVGGVQEQLVRLVLGIDSGRFVAQSLDVFDIRSRIEAGVAILAAFSTQFQNT